MVRGKYLDYLLFYVLICVYVYYTYVTILHRDYDYLKALNGYSFVFLLHRVTRSYQ